MMVRQSKNRGVYLYSFNCVCGANLFNYKSEHDLVQAWNKEQNES